MPYAVCAFRRRTLGCIPHTSFRGEQAPALAGPRRCQGAGCRPRRLLRCATLGSREKIRHIAGKDTIEEANSMYRKDERLCGLRRLCLLGLPEDATA